MSIVKNKLGRFLRDRTGSSALEFAIVALPFVFVSMAVVEFGRAFYSQNLLAQATDKAARLVLLDSGVADQEIIDAVIAAAGALDPQQLTVSVSSTSDQGVTFRNIAVTYRFDFILPALANVDVNLDYTEVVPMF